MDDYDKNKDGKIQWEDFSHLWAIHFYKSNESIFLPENIQIPIKEIFDRYDHDNNGTLDFSELTECLQSIFDRLGVKATANINDVKEFFMDYDRNGDGRISREDFINGYAIKFHAYWKMRVDFS